MAFGAVVRGTQMDADERGWTQMGPPMDTDFRRFFVGARRASPYPPLRPLWLRVHPNAEQRAAPTAQRTRRGGTRQPSNQATK